MGAVCPICEQHCGPRRIVSYERGVIELFPYRQGTVHIARYLCRRTGRTFSLLPMQLIPYHRYTLSAIVNALLLAQQLHDLAKRHPFREASDALSATLVTPVLFRRWLCTVVMGLRRAHAILAAVRDLTHLRSQTDRTGQLDEVAAYVTAFAARDPPECAAIDTLVRSYTQRTPLFLCGTPSQAR